MITNVGLFLVEVNQIIRILKNSKKFKMYFMFEYKCMQLFSKTKCIFKYKCMHIIVRGYGMRVLTLVLLNCFKLFFIHLKLELLTQFPASNDEKYFYLWNKSLAEHLPLNILSISVAFYLG